MGNSLLFVFVSFQPVGKNTLLIFSTVSPDFHNVSSDERELNASQIQTALPKHWTPISRFRRHRPTIVIELQRWAGRHIKLENIKERSEKMAPCSSKDWSPEGLHVCESDSLLSLFRAVWAQPHFFITTMCTLGSWSSTLW